jgi:hypothetical protein
VLEDVVDFPGVEPGIDRHQNAAGSRHAKVGFKHGRDVRA